MCLIGYPDALLLELFAGKRHGTTETSRDSEIKLATDYEKDMALLEDMFRLFSEHATTESN